MARKRQRARRPGLGSKTTTVLDLLEIDGQKIRMLNKIEEGTLYDMHITTRPIPPKDLMAKLARWKKFDRISAKGKPSKRSENGSSYAEDHKSAPQSDTFNAAPVISSPGHQQKRQFTIQNSSRVAKKNFLQRHCNIGYAVCMRGDTENSQYRPNSWLFRYINWTFYASFCAVFLSFTSVFYLVCFTFGGFLHLAGTQYPECIIVSGEHFGTNPDTKLSDAFALSWTTFTTVGYGNVYTTTGTDFSEGKTRECALIQFLCTSESFLGLLYAGMCAAILFGKINRIQSHSPVIFSNAVCLQYEEEERCETEEDNKCESSDEDDEDDNTEKESNNVRKRRATVGDEPQNVWKRGNFHRGSLGSATEDDEVDNAVEKSDKPTNVRNRRVSFSLSSGGGLGSPGTSEDTDDSNDIELVTKRDSINTFTDQYRGCPVIKFQVINELCNREGAEIIDAIMKVIAIKYKGKPGTSTYSSQYVRVPLVDYEHPFFCRVWHGVHVLDDTSPLLTEKAKRDLKTKHNGSWPKDWLQPHVIPEKLEFSDLVLTVAGISNVSAVTVHGYKRYKRGDVLIGFDFSSALFQNGVNGPLEVDLSLAHDVMQQNGGGNEELSRGHRLNSSINVRSSRHIFSRINGDVSDDSRPELDETEETSS